MDRFFLAVNDIDARGEIVHIVGAVCHLDTIDAVDCLVRHVRTCYWISDIVGCTKDGTNRSTTETTRLLEIIPNEIETDIVWSVRIYYA